MSKIQDKSSKNLVDEDVGDWRINLDSNSRRWFSRNLGLWRSRRHYLLDQDEVCNLDMFIKIEKFAEAPFGEARYRFSWWPENEGDFFKRKPIFEKEGVMEAVLSGHKLHRNRSFLDEKSSISSVRQVDEHEFIFESNYQGWDVIENTRLIDQDRYRSRSIHSWHQENLKIVEHHHEVRVEGPFPSIRE